MICGVSLSGLLSAYITINYPNIFSYSLCQSGSFWWEHKWFEEMARQSSPIQARFWISVGDQETDENVSHSPTMFQEISQISGVEKAVQVIEELGGEVNYHLYSGGHEFAPWKEEAADAFHWLFREN